MSVWRGMWNREVPRAFQEEGGSGGRHRLPPGGERKASDASVTLYHAEGCHLCDRALEVLREAQAELGFELDIVDVGGDRILEARYRESLPVVEIDGQRVFTYFVEPAALRARLGFPP